MLSITAATLGGGSSFAIETGATLDISAGSFAGTIVFAGSGEVVFAHATAGIAPTFDFSSSGGTIDFADAQATSASISGSSLIIGDVGIFQLTGTLPGSASVAADGSVVVACFAEGTRILTADGEVAVERLRAGDRVALARSGETRPVRWVGHRRMDCRRHPRPQDVLPVRVKAGAFGPGRPHRDLVLSPDHAVHGSALVDGPDVLVPMRYLVNGATIVQEAAGAITYFHVELDRHDVLLAEGLPTESYLNTGNRSAFANGGGPVVLHADFSRRVWETQGCAPLVLEGAALAGLRRRLLERAMELGHGATADAGLRLEVDGAAVEPQAYGDTLYVGLPDGARELALLSRSFVPAEVETTACDTRRLGIAVAAVAFDEAPVALEGPRLLNGWHAIEGGWRWTDGAARLDVRGASPVMLRLAPVGAGRYWLAAVAQAA